MAKVQLETLLRQLIDIGNELTWLRVHTTNCDMHLNSIKKSLDKLVASGTERPAADEGRTLE